MLITSPKRNRNKPVVAGATTLVRLRSIAKYSLRVSIRPNFRKVNEKYCKKITEEEFHVIALFIIIRV
jgi:hypothetical protein